LQEIVAKILGRKYLSGLVKYITNGVICIILLEKIEEISISNKIALCNLQLLESKKY